MGVDDEGEHYNNDDKHSFEHGKREENKIMSNNLKVIKDTQIIESIRKVNSAQKKERTDRMEDYLEIIYELVQQKGYVTSVDITECLNVSAPSVTKMMRRLQSTGHLEYEKYRGIRLTAQGISVAKNIRKKHELLTEFFRFIGVREEVANSDAEGIEHHLHPETLEKLEAFLQTVLKDKDKDKDKK